MLYEVITGKELTDNNYDNTDKQKVDFISVTENVDLDTLANKVDKVEGKELSSNDYTDADKAILDAYDGFTYSEKTDLHADDKMILIDSEDENAKKYVLMSELRDKMFKDLQFIQVDVLTSEEVDGSYVPTITPTFSVGSEVILWIAPCDAEGNYRLWWVVKTAVDPFYELKEGNDLKIPLDDYVLQTEVAGIVADAVTATKSDIEDNGVTAKYITIGNSTFSAKIEADSVAEALTVEIIGGE